MKKFLFFAVPVDEPNMFADVANGVESALFVVIDGSVVRSVASVFIPRGSMVVCAFGILDRLVASGSYKSVVLASVTL